MSKKLLILTAIAAAGLTLAAAVWWSRWHAGPNAPDAPGDADAPVAAAPPTVQAPAEPPTIDPTGVDPQVVKAVAAAAAQVRKAPGAASAWGDLGMVLGAHGFDAEARPCFVEAQRLDEREPRWPYLLALIERTDDPDAAIVHLQRAADLCGNEPDAPRLRLAELLLERDRLDDAEAQFQKVLAIQVNNARANLGMGRLAVRRGDLPSALTYLTRVLQEGSAAMSAQELLAQVYTRLGRPDDAAAARQAAQAAPDDRPWPDPFYQEVFDLRTGAKAMFAKAGRLMDAGRLDDAIALLEKAVEQYPQQGFGWLLYGQALVKKRRLTTARRVLLTALQYEPDSAEAMFFMGATMTLQNRHAEAAQWYAKATKVKPDFAMAHFNLGYSLNKTGDTAGAIAALRLTLQCQPDLPDAHALLGDLLAKGGEFAEALDHLRTAVKLSPNRRWVLQRLAEVEKSAAAAPEPRP